MDIGESTLHQPLIMRQSPSRSSVLPEPSAPDYGASGLSIPVIRPDLVPSKHPEFSILDDNVRFEEPNVRPGHEQEDLAMAINGESGDGAMSTLSSALCCLTGIGCLYGCARQQLINVGQYGFARVNGRPKIYFPGRHWVMNPLTEWVGKRNAGEDVISIPPVSIIRVYEGQYGLAYNNSVPELLLPGLHVRTTNAFKFSEFVSTGRDLIQHGPIKIFQVNSGQVRVCYDKGKVEIFPEGRYAVNNAAFRVAHTIAITQANLRFSKHPVLLDGGICLLVEGLLTFQVVDVQKLIKELGDRDLNRAVEDVTKAEIARVFAGLHLEQISSATVNPAHTSVRAPIKPAVSNVNSLLGDDSHSSPTPPSESVDHVAAFNPGSPEGEMRSHICAQIIRFITPYLLLWGVKVMNFQLESTKIADQEYAKQYEQASLGLAKAKANLRSVDAENEIQLRQSRARAKVVEIVAKAEMDAQLIRADGDAEARTIEAESRNTAADAMNEPFAQEFALACQRVEFAEAINAKVLNVMGDSVTGNTIGNVMNNPLQYVDPADVRIKLS